MRFEQALSRPMDPIGSIEAFDRSDGAAGLSGRPALFSHRIGPHRQVRTDPLWRSGPFV